MWKKITTMFSKQKREFNLIVIGLDQSGKTTILKYMKQGGDGDLSTIPTTGASFDTMRMGNVRFDITDLGGQKDLRAFWDRPLETTDAVIFVIDVTDEARYEEARQEFERVVAKIRNRKKNDARVPIMIAINKIDLLNEEQITLKKQKMTDLLNVKQLTEAQNPWQLHMISALKGTGLPEMMIWIYTTLTKKQLSGDTVLNEFLVFEKGGIPIMSTANRIQGDGTLAAGFFDAIQSFAKNICSNDIDEMIIKDMKIIFMHINELVGAVVINTSSDNAKAKAILKQVMDRITQVDAKNRNPDLIAKIYNDSVLDQMNS